MTNRKRAARVPSAGAAALLLLLGAGWGEAAEKSRVVEIRSYNLKPGAREGFHRLAEDQAVPLLKQFGIDVVAYGASLHDDDSYILIRSFPSLEERQQSEDKFYGSEEWTKGPREAVLAAIVSYTTVVRRLDEATVRGLRAKR